MLGTYCNTQLSLQLHDVFSADNRNINAHDNHAEILFHCLELRKGGRQVDLLTAPSLQDSLEFTALRAVSTHHGSSWVSPVIM